MTAAAKDRFRGCLLGLAVGDAWGAPYEGHPPERMRARFASPADLRPVGGREMYYTDDTQMMISVAETLAQRRRMEPHTLHRLFAQNYTPSRGYGRGARRVLEALCDGRDYRQAAEETFPGGSYGNGGAMRVAPVGLFFHERTESIFQQAKAASEPTHLHPLGYQGAQLIALATAFAVRTADQPFDRRALFAELAAHAWAPEYVERMQQAADTPTDKLLDLGNGIAALDSAPTAIACFACAPDDYEQCVGAAVLLGGDCDTIAAMAGAMAGARLGLEGIPLDLLQALENGPQGRSYLIDLADRLYAAWTDGEQLTLF